jgi:O-methyltransferase
VRRLGYDLMRFSSDPARQSPSYPVDFDKASIQLWKDVEPFTMTSAERIVALREAVVYIVKHQIPGDIVECGVWKGGSMMAIARTLIENGVTDRRLFLYDTFEGMSQPTAVDRDFRGKPAARVLAESDKRTSMMWAYSRLDEVQRNMQRTGYDEQKIVFVQGKVEDSLPARAPEQIALLRLDTDWYESTYHELNHLFPRLSIGGVLIIDDYGYWQGARKAVDEYFSAHRVPVLLNRIDDTGRICVKVRAS